ncbi:hypothetical protein [Streptococcus parauberis]|uniref:hypothetical protein n=1 Tax=Streptococcus parauberis TaxID=1348 RepID=UPI0039B0496A
MTKKKDETKNTEERRYYLLEKRGKEVEVAFIGSEKVIVGKLIYVTRYEYILEVTNKETGKVSEPIVIHKGAVKYIW